MSAEDRSLSNRPFGFWRSWRGKPGPRIVLGAGYAIAFVVTAVTVYLSSTRAPPVGFAGLASRTILTIVLANLVLILALVAAAGWSVVRLIGEQSRDAGAKLHLRFVSLFALAAFVPAIVVALFFGALVTRGVETWFSKRVRTVVENSATAARSYVNEQTRGIYGDLLAMATDLDRAAPLFASSPVAYGRILEGQAANRYFPAAYVIDHEGRLLASAESDNAPTFVAPPAATLASADKGDVVMRPFEASDLIRAVYKMKRLQRRLPLRRPPGRSRDPEPPALHRGRPAGLPRGGGEPQPDPGGVPADLCGDRAAGAGGRGLARHGRRQRHLRAGGEAGGGRAQGFGRRSDRARRSSRHA